MDADEYYATTIAKTASSWAWYTSGTVQFKAILGEGLSQVHPRLPITLRVYEDYREHNIATLARREVDNGFPTVNSHILVDAWGAFESFIEDICSAALTIEPWLHGRARDIVSDLFNNVHRNHKVGLDKVRMRLKLVSLKCDPSEELENRVRYAHQLRNAIVHNKSIADDRFVEWCGPYSRHSVGDRLVVTSSLLKELVGALIVYGLLIVNNDRKEKGVPPAFWPLITPDPSLESPYKQQWGHISRETMWFPEPWQPLFYHVEL